MLLKFEFFNNLFHLVFLYGVTGFFARYNTLISYFINLELIFLSLNMNLILSSIYWNSVQYSIYLNTMEGQLFVLFNLAVAGIESAIGLALLISIYHSHFTIDVNEFINLRW